MMMAEVNSDEMCSIIAAMIARRKQEQTMTDVNVVVVVDIKSKVTQEKISPRDVRSFTFLPDTTATNEDDKGEDTDVIRKGDNDDAAAAAAAPTQGQDEEQLMTPTAAATKRSGGVLEEYAITFLRDVLRHSVTFTQHAYNMRIQEWDVARALEFYYSEKGEFSIEDYDNEEEDNDDDDSYDNEEEDDDDDDSQYSFDESSTDKDEYEESMSDNHEETMAEVNDINLTTTTLTTDIKEFTDYLIHPIFAEFNFHVEMEIKGIVLLRNALIDYLKLVDKCDLSNKEEVSENLLLSKDFLRFSKTEDDILFGCGGDISKHPGNVRFREKARELAPLYVACGDSKEEKYKVSELLVDCMNAENRRFLEKGSDGLYYEVIGNDVMKKASQVLREVATSNESSTTNVPSDNTTL